MNPYQVIQVYLSLVVERSKCLTFKELQMPKVILLKRLVKFSFLTVNQVLAMSTFIYQNIMRKSRGHAAVARYVCCYSDMF